MKTILHMSVSIDGFIAKPDGDSDWVSPIDGDLFLERSKSIGCMIVGHRTFSQFSGSLYPVDGVCTIVVAKNAPENFLDANVHFVQSPQEALSQASEKGFATVLLAGGGHLNGAFLEAGLIDELFLSVHPLVLGEGIRLFEGSARQSVFDLVGTRELGESLVELHYKTTK